MTHVLITRPLSAAQNLAVQLDGLGLLPIVMPLYTFSPLQPELDFTAVWSDRKARKLAVFTSPRAVQHGLAHIPKECMDRLEFAVVGSASAAELKAAGYTDQLCAKTGYTSEDLLQIPQLAAQAGEAVIFCAPDGREVLATGLHELGWEVSKALVYERIALEPGNKQLKLLAESDQLISIWTSISAIKLAKAYLPTAIWQKILEAPALVISTRIQHHLESMGASQLVLANGPGNSDLLRSIKQMTDATGIH